MKIKTSELIGPALDWAVAKCEGHIITVINNQTQIMVGDIKHKGIHWFNPSESWPQGGPIIERERISVCADNEACRSESGEEILRPIGWLAYKAPAMYWMTPKLVLAPTPLIAAMRCLVASKLGDEIEIPEELK